MPEPVPIRRVSTLHTIEDLDGDTIRLSHEEAVPAKQRRSRKKPWKGARMYALIDPTFMERFEMTYSERRVIDHILSRTILESGDATIIGAQMAETLGWDRAYASRVLRGLVARNAILEVGPKTYRVNAFLGYRGDVSSWNEQTLIDPEPIWEKP